MIASRRCLAPCAVVTLVAIAVSVIGLDGSTSPTSALGAVQPITPAQMTPRMDRGIEPDVSRRGEAVTVLDPVFPYNPPEGALVGLDNTTIESTFRANHVGVSGNGCVAAYILEGGDGGIVAAPPPEPPNGQTRIATLDRCNPANSRVLADPKTGEGPFGRPALNFDGSVVVVPLRYRVARFDIAAAVTETAMPLPATDDTWMVIPYDEYPDVERVDVSADGRVVVAALRSYCDCSDPDVEVVVAWDVGAPTVEVVSTPDGSVSGVAEFPSVSDDGSFVSFVSRDRRTGQSDQFNGPWAYVRRRGTPTFTLVSPADDQASFSSISEDGSQVAFVHRSPTCAGSIDIPGCEPNPSDLLSVAFSSVPGLSTGMQVEEVNRAANGQIDGSHQQPSLSGSGRYVAWSTDGARTLLGQPNFATESQVVLRQRDASFRVDGLDFGPRPSGTSLTRTAVVTNTGRSSILPGEIVTTSPSYVVVGGSCAPNAWIPPGATCTVDVRFDAPLGDGPVTAELIVRELGFEALTATGRLTARVVAPPPEPEPEPAPEPDPTPTVTLSAAPNPLDFGPVAVLIATPVQEIVVANSGNSGAPIQLFVSGPNATDFEIVSDSCRTVALAPGATCLVRVRMIASGGGPRIATLDVRAGAASIAVGLRGEGHLAPQLAASPGTITERASTTIVGQGFVPGETVSVVVEPAGVVVTGLVGPDGTFQTPLSAFGRLRLGPYQLVAPARPFFYDEVRANLLVALGTYQPQGPTSVVFRDNVMVVRGS